MAAAQQTWTQLSINQVINILGKAAESEIENEKKVDHELISGIYDTIGNLNILYTRSLEFVQKLLLDTKSIDDVLRLLKQALLKRTRKQEFRDANKVNELLKDYQTGIDDLATFNYHTMNYKAIKHLQQKAWLKSDDEPELLNDPNNPPSPQPQPMPPSMYAQLTQEAKSQPSAPPQPSPIPSRSPQPSKSSKIKRSASMKSNVSQKSMEHKSQSNQVLYYIICISQNRK